ncbi:MULTISPECIES: nucleotide exchange factor GrpE [Pseudonocardia]|uniref:Protein GrpE n=2 Tax=Pseudonocardia TaxID=1847 RepID=A0A1Y2MRZ8_PSEAH|nr:MULTISPECIES: nucleotide exchange factor GrpE [Pseudonocardia]OSY37992.1 heat shock protein GrpE [Pseudonocardia autotrophica]TDN74653.1 molecular chaperone GrpE [Pseudonocardia autotrophica]BBG05425.1 protein GrpE [Pseudonocardia autotrophica]GEC26404.1 protein GrpE [Pseudonocardia saturnea]
MTGNHERDEQQDEPVTFRDRRKVDPETGEARSNGETGAAHAAAPGSDGTDPVAGPADGVDPEVEKLTAEVAERTADLQRVSAEYANYRRRADRDREQTQLSAKVSFVTDLLTVLDDFERAEQHGDLTGPFKSAADKVTGVVTKLGLESFGAEGEPFDPQLHEAVQHEPAEGSGPTVTVLSTVLRRGYRIADRILRPAMVTVQDRPEAEASQAPGAPEVPEVPEASGNSESAEGDAGQPGQGDPA